MGKSRGRGQSGGSVRVRSGGAAGSQIQPISRMPNFDKALATIDEIISKLDSFNLLYARPSTEQLRTELQKLCGESDFSFAKFQAFNRKVNDEYTKKKAASDRVEGFNDSMFMLSTLFSLFTINFSKKEGLADAIFKAACYAAGHFLVREILKGWRVETTPPRQRATDELNTIFQNIKLLQRSGNNKGNVNWHNCRFCREPFNKGAIEVLFFILKKHGYMCFTSQKDFVAYRYDALTKEERTTITADLGHYLGVYNWLYGYVKDFNNKFDSYGLFIESHFNEAEARGVIFRLDILHMQAKHAYAQEQISELFSPLPDDIGSLLCQGLLSLSFGKPETWEALKQTLQLVIKKSDNDIRTSLGLSQRPTAVSAVADPIVSTCELNSDPEQEDPESDRDSENDASFESVEVAPPTRPVERVRPKPRPELFQQQSAAAAVEQPPVFWTNPHDWSQQLAYWHEELGKMQRVGERKCTNKKKIYYYAFFPEQTKDKISAYRRDGAWLRIFETAFNNGLSSGSGKRIGMGIVEELGTFVLKAHVEERVVSRQQWVKKDSNNDEHVLIVFDHFDPDFHKRLGRKWGKPKVHDVTNLGDKVYTPPRAADDEVAAVRLAL